ncbi:MAG: hypothetical protein ACTHL6_14170 [Arthrobacter sp.]
MACGVGRDGDVPAPGSVFDGVGDEVVDGLTEAVWIEVTGGGTVGEQVQGNAAGLRPRLCSPDAVPDNVGQVGVLRVDGHGIGGDGQEVPDQVQEPVCVPFHDGQVHLQVRVKVVIDQGQLHVSQGLVVGGVIVCQFCLC